MSLIQSVLVQVKSPNIIAVLFCAVKWLLYTDFWYSILQDNDKEEEKKEELMKQYLI